MTEENELTPAQIAALEAGRTPPEGYPSVSAWLRDYEAWLRSKGRGSLRPLADYIGITYPAVYSWFSAGAPALPNDKRIRQLLDFREQWEINDEPPAPLIDEVSVSVGPASADRLRELAEESGMKPAAYIESAMNHAIEQGLVFGTRVIVEARKGKAAR